MNGDNGPAEEPIRPIRYQPELIGHGKNKEHRTAGDAALNKLLPFSSAFVRALLYNKHILFMGDSLTRGLYKDLIALLQDDMLINDKDLKLKTETSFRGDRQINILPLDKDRVFQQAREYQTAANLIQYVFTTRVMKDHMEAAIQNILKKAEYPDVIVLNSMLWDVTRYWEFYRADADSRFQESNEQFALTEFQERLSMLLRRLRMVLPPHTQVIWVNYPWMIPSDKKQPGIFCSSDKASFDDKHHITRVIYNDCNYAAAQIVRQFGYDVLDYSFYFRDHSLVVLRCSDYLHWNRIGVRIMTQLLIGHLMKNVDRRLIPREIFGSYESFLYEIEQRKRDDYRQAHGAGLLQLMDGEEREKCFDEALRFQTAVAKLSFDKLIFRDPKLREAMINDIEMMRMQEFLRLHNRSLSPKDFDLLKRNGRTLQNDATENERARDILQVFRCPSMNSVQCPTRITAVVPRKNNRQNDEPSTSKSSH